MVAECSRAETGVGATMAPHSQLSNGTWADFVKAARQKKAKGSSMAVLFTSMAVIFCRTISVDSVPRLFWTKSMAETKARPPRTFIHKAR